MRDVSPSYQQLDSSPIVIGTHEAQVSWHQRAKDHLNHILSTTPDEMHRFIMDVPLKLWDEEEVTLTTLTNPTRTQKMARSRFWKECDIIIDSRGDLNALSLYNVYRGLCTKNTVDKWFRSHTFVAWFFTHPADYEVLLDEALTHSLDRMREIIDLPITITDADGNIKPNSTTINAILAISKMLDMRKHGGYLQRIEEKSMHLHGTIPASQQGAALADNSMDQIEAQIKEIEAKIQKKSLPSEFIIDKVRDDSGE